MSNNNIFKYHENGNNKYFQFNAMGKNANFPANEYMYFTHNFIFIFAIANCCRTTHVVEAAQLLQHIYELMHIGFGKCLLLIFNIKSFIFKCA